MFNFVFVTTVCKCKLYNFKAQSLLSVNKTVSNVSTIIGKLPNFNWDLLYAAQITIIGEWGGGGFKVSLLIIHLVLSTQFVNIKNKLGPLQRMEKG